MDLFSQNCPCCDSAKADVRTRYPTQNNGTHSIYHCRSCDIYFSDTFATPMAGLRTPLSRIIEALKARTEGQGLNATARIFAIASVRIIPSASQLITCVGVLRNAKPSLDKIYLDLKESENPDVAKYLKMTRRSISNEATEKANICLAIKRSAGH